MVLKNIFNKTFLNKTDETQIATLAPVTISTGSLSDDLELEGGLHNRLYLYPAKDSDEGSQKLVTLTKRITSCDEGATVIYVSAGMGTKEFMVRMLEAMASDEKLQGEKVPEFTYRDIYPTIIPKSLEDSAWFAQHLGQMITVNMPRISFYDNGVEIADVVNAYEKDRVGTSSNGHTVIIVDYPHLFITGPDDDFIPEIKNAYFVLSQYAETNHVPIVTSSNFEIDEYWVTTIENI